VKSDANCNLSGFGNSCNIDSSSSIEDTGFSIPEDIPSVPPTGQ
jgi:hypothetical protein